MMRRAQQMDLTVVKRSQRAREIPALVSAIAAVFVTGCANPPERLRPVGATQTAQPSVAPPVHDHIDRSTFDSASFRYPAGAGKHNVPAGEYLLTGVATLLSDRNARQIRLAAFASDCDRKGNFLPEVVCWAQYRLEWREGAHLRSAAGQVQKNIGNMRAKSIEVPEFVYVVPVGTRRVDYGDASIRRQLLGLADAMLDDIRAKVTALQ